MSPDDRNQDVVIAQVETVFFNLSSARGMVVTVDGANPVGRVYRLPRGPLLPAEAPERAAIRVLAEIVGITDVLHEPVLLGHRADPSVDGRLPTLTVSYAVLGPRPSDSAVTARSVPVDQERSKLGENVDQPSVVLRAREAVKELLETTPLALTLLDPRLSAFTLNHLRDVYVQVLGPGLAIDTANFRRKVEAAKDFVVPVALRDAVRGRGRPARWYTAGSAQALDPPIRLRRNRANSACG